MTRLGVFLLLPAEDLSALQGYPLYPLKPLGGEAPWESSDFFLKTQQNNLGQSSNFLSLSKKRFPFELTEVFYRVAQNFGGSNFFDFCIFSWCAEKVPAQK